jgi:dihydropteroate synthase
MKTFTIESIEQFNILAARLREKGYKPWQYQDDNGFRTWFAKAGKDDIEVITHSEEVHKAIMGIRAT